MHEERELRRVGGRSPPHPPFPFFFCWRMEEASEKEARTNPTHARKENNTKRKEKRRSGVQDDKVKEAIWRARL